MGTASLNRSPVVYISIQYKIKLLLGFIFKNYTLKLITLIRQIVIKKVSQTCFMQEVLNGFVDSKSTVSYGFPLVCKISVFVSFVIKAKN